ncbi:alanine dehydrogenase [uncultured Algibacter sp.]|uniref:alanine dehydrogenase n=1 Tax=uncultured Algibacter sp. TaxID=298659 RepID=UPI00260624F3|nr:alanine dehydrogenase [uncultured Algibacter sp.]
MKIGVPIEIKNNENRVGMTPSGVFELTKRDHAVYVQQNAGFNSGFLDEDYIGAGATILDSIEEVYAAAEMIVKVKEPIEPEYKLIKPNQVVFTYFHFASSEVLTNAMIDSKAVCIAYETVEDADGSLPLLIPMSEVAGRMSIQQGAKYLEKPIMGRGILLGGIPGVPPAKVLILGAGVVGLQAARMASGLGASVHILDINMKALRHVSDVMPNNVVSEYSSEYNIRKHIVDSDLIIGGVLIKGAKAPKLITKDMLKEMRPGTVMVDVAVDQGGCFETTKPTTHQDPTYIIDEVVHYSVANMPGAVPYTSTMGLTNVTLPYVIKLASEGWEKACENNKSLAKGLNIVKGEIVYKEIAEAFDMEMV